MLVSVERSSDILATTWSWRDRLFQVLDKLAEDPYHSTLKTHKLSGQLEGLWACWVEYDCRIVFAFESDPNTGEDVIVLIDLGTHDEVY